MTPCSGERRWANGMIVPRRVMNANTTPSSSSNGGRLIESAQMETRLPPRLTSRSRRGAEGGAVALEEHDVVLRPPRPLALLGLEAELVARPGGLAGGGEPEHEHAVRFELARCLVAGAHDFGAGVQAQHSALIGPKHPLPEETFRAFAGVVGAEGDVDVVLRDREDLHP